MRRGSGVVWALMWLVSAAAAQPGSETLLREGLLALSRGDVETAAARLEEAARQNPQDARVWLALAQARQKNGRSLAAEEAAGRAEQLAPREPMILRGLVIFYEQTERWPQAAAAESRYAELVPNDGQAPRRAASFYLRANQPAAAIREMERALDREPRDEAAQFELAWLLLQREDFSGAARRLEAARQLLAPSPQIELALGVAYYGQRRFADAVATFLKAATLAPDLEQPLLFLGRILDHAGNRLPEVTARFAAFVQSHPENYVGHFLHGKALLVQEQTDTAEKSLLRSLELNAGFWESHFQLGVVREGRRAYAEAVSSFERAASLDPTNAAAHYRLARLYDRLNQPKRAAQERALHRKYAEVERRVAEEWRALPAPPKTPPVLR